LRRLASPKDLLKNNFPRTINAVSPRRSQEGGDQSYRDGEQRRAWKRQKFTSASVLSASKKRLILIGNAIVG
jgi:hypothetical protein